jgi:hypothetical protein
LTWRRQAVKKFYTAQTGQTMRTLALAFALGISAASAEPIDSRITVNLGALVVATSDGTSKDQMIEVKNGTSNFLEYVGVDCGFYDATGTLVGNGGRAIHNIPPGEVVPSHVGGLRVPSAVRATCRVDMAKTKK